MVYMFGTAFHLQVLCGILVSAVLYCKRKNSKIQNEHANQKMKITNSVSEEITEVGNEVLGDDGTYHVVTPNSFLQFQKNYILVFLLAMGADWIHGPYIYKLYQDYEFSEHQIATLFVAGFAASALIGIFVGAWADQFGRKNACLMYALFYGLSCLTKHFHNYKALLFGRLLGGTATSILFSSFESWMIAEHNNLGFAPELLGSTFTWAWGLNGPIAVGSGVLANYTVEFTGKSVSAFDLQLLILIIMAIIVHKTWKENHGKSALKDTLGTVKRGINEMLQSRNICLICFSQTFFESSMYIFVFLWTPILGTSNEGKTIFHGWIFATFMIACMLGSEILKYLQNLETLKNHEIAKLTFICAAVLFCLLSFLTQSYFCSLVLFCLFEICCGIYFPLIGMLRGEYINDNLRSTLTALCRIPLNIIVIFILLNTDNFSKPTILFMACGLNALACLCASNITPKILNVREISYDIVLGDEQISDLIDI